ncbi:hypothetical protein WSM22_39160 [Cytophagales bacterium WSM2-2]|nr:hypothetical protein WSM22_39160 [Cytophagales bacterium WSM2-2]
MTGNIYVADQGNNRIRKITPSGNVTTLAGTTKGFADGQGTTALFNRPIGIATDTKGNIYIADTYNHRIRKITAEGIVTTLTGSILGFTDGPGTTALFNLPTGIAVNPTGIIYVIDNDNHNLRKITIH